MLFLLLIRLKFAFPLALLKLLVLVHLFAEVPESFSFGVKEEIIELAEVELDCWSLLLFVLALLGCLCTHFVELFAQFLVTAKC